MNLRKALIYLWLLMTVLTAACGDLEDDPTTSRTTIAVVNTSNPGSSGELSFLFATNHYVDRVYRINLDTLDVDDVKVGKKPRAIAASPDGRFVACANEDSNSISVIPTVSLNAWSVAVGWKPLELRFSPNGRWLAVANYEYLSVALIDTNNGAMSVIYACTGPTSLDFSSDSETLAVACYGSGSVQLIDTNEKQVIHGTMEDGTEVYDRTQVVLFGRENTNAQNLLFTGFREGPWDEAASGTNFSIGVIDLEEDPWETDFVEAAINPRFFFWNHAGDKLIAIHHGQDPEVETYNEDHSVTYTYDSGGALIPGQISVLEVDEDRNVETKDRYIISGNPVAAAIDPNRDFIAVADKDDGKVVFVDLDEKTQFEVSTKTRPYALAFNSAGTKLVVVHETPLMPVSLVDVAGRSSKLVYESLSMNRWFD